MTVDPMHNVSPGDPLQLTARQVNAWNKLASQQLAIQAQAQPPEPAPYLTLYARNDTTAALSQFQAVQIKSLELDASGVQFRTKPLVKVTKVDALDNALAIAVEPIGAGKIGRVAVSGVVPCRITNTDAANKFARPTPNSTLLTGAGSGPAEIIWIEGVGGTNVQGLVRLGPYVEVVRLGKVSSTWSKGTVATVTQYTGYGDATSTTFSARNRFADVTVSGTSKWVLCTKVDTTWLLTAAEC
jgi:hypothetical protein